MLACTDREGLCIGRGRLEGDTIAPRRVVCGEHQG